MSKTKGKGKDVQIHLTDKQAADVQKLYDETGNRMSMIYENAFRIGLDEVMREHKAHKADGFRGVK